MEPTQEALQRRIKAFKEGNPGCEAWSDHDCLCYMFVQDTKRRSEREKIRQMLKLSALEGLRIKVDSREVAK